MDIRKLIELRNKIYETYYIKDHGTAGNLLDKRNHAINDFIDAGRDYYYDPKLTFLQLHYLIRKEEMNFAGIKAPLSTKKVDWDALKNARTLMLAALKGTEEISNEEKQQRMNDYIEAGRIYYENSTLSYEVIEGLYEFEELERYEQEMLNEYRKKTGR